MHTNPVFLCRILADLMHTNSVLCRLFADSMHTLRRTNQCQSKCRSTCGGRPLAAAGARRRRRAPASCAKPRRFARDGEAAAREGEAAAREGDAAAREGDAAAREGEAAVREGDAAAREGEAGGGAAREGEAVRLSALEVLLPAAAAAPRALRQGYNLFPPPAPSSSHDVHRVGRAGDREGSKRAGGRSAPRRAWETRDVARGLGPILCACVVTFPNACVRGDGG